jgi:Flp pilus assembly protein TadD
MAYVQLGNYAEAERELALAAPEDKEGRVYYQLGRVYQALKRTAEAERAFARSDQLKRAAEQKNQNRVQQVARAEAALRER